MSRLRRRQDRSERGRDLDLDSSVHMRLPAARGPEQEYLRLVANPFLWLGTLFLVLAILPLAAPLVFCVFPLLLHTHCLDCGRTGRVTRWRAHACPAVAERRLLDRPRRLRGPTPGVQLLLWMWAIAVVGALARGWIRESGS